MPSTLATARPVLAPFAAMGVLWGTFAAALPDIKAMLGVDEATLGMALLATPIAAVLAMLLSPVTGDLLGRLALPLAHSGRWQLPLHCRGRPRSCGCSRLR